MSSIYTGDALKVLAELPDNSVHCCITSPPYWGLRDYGVEGQLGLERTPEKYVQRLVSIFRQVRRVLRNDGTLWLVMGDRYSQKTMGKRSANPRTGAPASHKNGGRRNLDIGDQGIVVNSGLSDKNLVGIPWRVAFALQAIGWYLRSDIVWAKSNPMPESVLDRPTKAHEYIFLLSKSSKYYYDAYAVREKSTERPSGNKQRKMPEERDRPRDHLGASVPYIPDGTGRNRRSVWAIPTKPYKGAHFSTFPTALVEPCMLAGTSERGRCPVCGAPWIRVVTKLGKTKRELADEHGTLGYYEANQNPLNYGPNHHSPERTCRTIGWGPSCKHTDLPIPCIVLDPFAGSGTVAEVAIAHGRDYTLIELNERYVELAKQRIARATTGDKKPKKPGKKLQELDLI